MIERLSISSVKSKVKLINETCAEDQSIKLSIRLYDIFGESYSIKNDCKVGLKLELIKEKTGNSLTINKETQLGKLCGVEIYSTCSDIEFNKFKLFKTEYENELIMEIKLDRSGVFKLAVLLNGKTLVNDLFIESKGGKKNGIEEEMTSTNQSISTKRTTFNKSRQSSTKRGNSTSKNGSNLFIKKDKKFIIKNGSIQSKRKKSLNRIITNGKKTNIKDILMNNKGKLDKLLKSKKGVLIKKKLS